MWQEVPDSVSKAFDPPLESAEDYVTVLLAWSLHLIA